MKNKLYSTDKVAFYYDKETSSHKVVVIDPIEEGEIIEECIVKLDSSNNKIIKTKSFKWPKGCENPICNVVVNGFGSLMERSIDMVQVNVDWECDLKHNLIIFKANRNIEVNEMLTIYDEDPELMETIEKDNFRIERIGEIRKFIRRLKNNLVEEIEENDFIEK